MKMKNKYIIRARISEAKFRQIVKLYAFDMQANQIAQLTGISRNSINSYLKAMRIRIAEFMEEEERREQNGVKFDLDNDMEAFWIFTKTRLARFRGLPQSSRKLHIKESEFRYRHRNDNLYYILLKIFRERPLKLS